MICCIGVAPAHLIPHTWTPPQTRPHAIIHAPHRSRAWTARTQPATRCAWMACLSCRWQGARACLPPLLDTSLPASPPPPPPCHQLSSLLVAAPLQLLLGAASSQPGHHMRTCSCLSQAVTRPCRWHPGGNLLLASPLQPPLPPCWCAHRHLQVDAETLRALDVFRAERHPSNMGIGATKEGFSVFGLLQRCVTQMVRRRWPAITRAASATSAAAASTAGRPPSLCSTVWLLAPAGQAPAAPVVPAARGGPGCAESAPRHHRAADGGPRPDGAAEGPHEKGVRRGGGGGGQQGS